MAIGRPGDGVLHEGEAGEGIGLQGIEAQSHGPGPVQAAQIIVKFIAELIFQPGEKGFGEHGVPPLREYSMIYVHYRKPPWGCQGGQYVIKWEKTRRDLGWITV
jgi:hypothetical protein